MQTNAPSKELMIEEEYRVWKKNSPYLYDVIASYELEWPSLSVSWFPEKALSKGKNYSLQRLLIGTHTSGGETNSLIIGQLKMPLDGLKMEEKYYSEETGEYGGFGLGGSAGRFEIIQRINHPSEVNRARYMPQNPDIIATKTGAADVLVFDRTRHPSKPPKDGSVTPQATLTGHKEEGYGLDWNPFEEGHLISSSDDGLICTWDISGGKESLKPATAPTRVYAEHRGIVEDVCWHRTSAHFFASAGDDRLIKVWDARTAKSASTISGHRAEVNSAAFSPHNEFLLLSGSKDKTVALWDLRNPSVRLHMMEGHDEAIFRVEWAPFSDSILASCGADRRLIVWDLSRIGREQTPEDAADGAPELVFAHCGHTDKVSDMGWNANEEWTMATVAENNGMQVWKVAKEVYREDVEVNEEDLE